MSKVNIAEKFSKITEYWKPYIGAELNGQHVKFDKLKGEFIVVPRGVEHKPVADEECWLLLFEPATTLNTGNVANERTVRELERV